MTTDFATLLAMDPMALIRRGTRAVERRLEIRREHATLLRDITNGIAEAAHDPRNVLPRPCPACGAERHDPRPTLRAPVYTFHRCNACSLLFTPRVLRPELEQQHFELRPAARTWWSTLYHDARRYQEHNGNAPLVARLAAIAPSLGTAVDVGCGFGQLVAELSRRFERVVGTEVDPKKVRVARAMFKLDLRAIQVEDLDLEPGTVDLVVMNQILEHARDARPLVHAAHRLLKPGGVLWIGVPHAGSLGMRLRGGAHRTVSTHQHLNLFNAAAVRALADATGFHVTSVRSDDKLDVSATDWALERAPSLLYPALAADKSIGVFARLSRLPSRLGVGAQLEATLTKE